MGWGHFLAALILETMMLQQGKYIHHSGIMLDNRGHFLFGFLSWQLMHFRFWTQRVTSDLNTYHQSDARRWLKLWPTPRSASWPTPRPGHSGIRNFSPWWDGTALKSLLCLMLYYNKTQKFPGFELNRGISQNPCPCVHDYDQDEKVISKLLSNYYQGSFTLLWCFTREKNDRQCVWWSCDLVVATMIVWFRKGALLDFLIKHNEFQISQHWELWSC